jgi:hypothetical protein
MVGAGGSCGTAVHGARFAAFIDTSPAVPQPFATAGPSDQRLRLNRPPALNATVNPGPRRWQLRRIGARREMSVLLLPQMNLDAEGPFSLLKILEFRGVSREHVADIDDGSGGFFGW